MAPVEMLLEVPEYLVESGGEGLNSCFQCGTCTGVCPWNLVDQFNVRFLMRTAQLGIDPDDVNDLWKCVTCGYCVANCPRGVPIIDVFRSMRALTGSSGSFPSSFRAMLASERQNGNPWSGEAAERNNWAEKLAMKPYDGSQDFMLYVCCMVSYDRDGRAVGQAIHEVLDAANVSVGLAPSEAVCCGCSVREAGEIELMESMGQQNVELFQSVGNPRILVSSPHCYNAIKKDYPKMGGEFEVVHYSQLFRYLIAAGLLTPGRLPDQVVTYHDPCYLGRHNGEYDAPRAVIEAIPGITLKEMPRNREDSLCCGGGGGGMFMETDIEKRFSVLRVKEALETGAGTLITACSYCRSMLQDAVKTLDCEDRLQVIDLAELVARSLETRNR